MSAQRRLALTCAICLLIAWGVLTFGAVFPWAYGPLLAGAILLGVHGYSLADAGDRQAVRPLAITLFATASVVLTQLVPLPAELLTRVSPGTEAFLRLDHDPSAVNATARAHAISIAPPATWRGLGFLVAFSLFVIGAPALFRRIRLRHLAHGVVILGLAVAVFGIVQRATFNRRVYWMFNPYPDPANVFGPFENRNHFAGWMVMTAALTGGYLCGLFAEAKVDGGSWRYRIVWLSSLDASAIVFTGFAFAVMASSIVWTLSRSGIAALGIVVLLICERAFTRFEGPRQLLVPAVILLASGLTAYWKGVGVLADWYGRADTLIWRVRLWADTRPILHDFRWFGSGLATYGVATAAYPMPGVTSHPAYAHNDYVQILSEGGLLLALAATGSVAMLATRIRRAFAEPQAASVYWIRIGAVIGLIAIGVQEISDFSLQMPGNAVLFATLAAIAIHRSNAPIGRSMAARQTME